MPNHYPINANELAGKLRVNAKSLRVFEFKDGPIADGREHFHDLYAWDEFWS